MNIDGLSKKELLELANNKRRESKRNLCECGAPAEETYCQDCMDMYSDRAETEREIEQAEMRREGER